nr:alpha-amylase [uncultured Clostridium sp.]
MIIFLSITIMTSFIFLLIYIYLKIRKRFNDIENQMYNLKKSNNNFDDKIKRLGDEIDSLDEEVCSINVENQKSDASHESTGEVLDKKKFYRQVDKIIRRYVENNIGRYIGEYRKDRKRTNGHKNLREIEDNRKSRPELPEKTTVLDIDKAFQIGIENIKNKKKIEYEISKFKEECGSTEIKNSKGDNKTMMQFFEWYYPNDGSLWMKVKNEAENLKSIGITSLWLPPAYKAHNGINDVGYSAYDLYDLGEFDQKGTIRTKYGTKDEYIEAIKEAHRNGIEIYGDVVFNHKAGADDTELVEARQVDENDRNVFIGEEKQIRAHTIFSFPGRKEKYSAYKWTANDFDGVDYDEISKQSGIFKFQGKEWEEDVDKEKGNYDFLMFADLDMDSPYVIEELKRWGKWYMDETQVDGFRLDAIKHIRFDFFKEWLKEMRDYSSKELFSVGEYWTWDVGRLRYYLDRCGHSMKLFDPPLHYNFHSASNSLGYFDMRRIKDNTLLQLEPEYTVTFVDNHDTQLGQSLESWVSPWFKPLAYTFILTREEGYPCVFYGDYYGIPDKGYEGIKDILDRILSARKKYAYGIQHDYLDDKSVIGWTREGDDIHENSGLAALITVACGGKKKMNVGIKHKGEKWIDMTRQNKCEVTIDKDGNGEFYVQDGSYSIWISKDA